MCGIVGGISDNNVVDIILDGLKKLEYRGYDSVGVAVIHQDKLQRQRSTGRVKSLVDICTQANFVGNIGIGHTRWATHGVVTVDNAHPHFSNEEFAVVHNGIIENYIELRERLTAVGYVFQSQTDTEVIVHLVHYYNQQSTSFREAVTLAIQQLKGAYAIGVISSLYPNKIVCSKLSSPLIIGVTDSGNYFASDVLPLLEVTKKVVYLNDGDIAVLSLHSIELFDKNSQPIVADVKISQLSHHSTELLGYRHYMQKEIYEQSIAISDTIKSFGNEINPLVFGDVAYKVFAEIDNIQILACGTSYNSGMVAKYWLEDIVGIHCSVEIASEYRYRKVAINPKTLIISLSQSGETADTLASVKYAIAEGMTHTLSICNVAESSLVRLSELVFLTKAGPEIGVAATKSFTTQLVALLYLALSIAKVKKISEAKIVEIFNEMKLLPRFVDNILALEPIIQFVAKDFKYTNSCLYLGRNTLWPIAVEGALKLKEISYIHAESYAAGELKHGPLALIDKDMPVICLLQDGEIADKVKSNVQEVLSRDGIVYLFTNMEVTELENQPLCKIIKLPKLTNFDVLEPLLFVLPLQLLAYHIALIKGTDVDKPRNLAKSVTVE